MRLNHSWSRCREASIEGLLSDQEAPSEELKSYAKYFDQTLKDFSQAVPFVAILFFLSSCGGDEEEIQPADAPEEELSKEVTEEIPEVASEAALEPAWPEAVNQRRT